MRVVTGCWLGLCLGKGADPITGALKRAGLGTASTSGKYWLAGMNNGGLKAPGPRVFGRRRGGHKLGMVLCVLLLPPQQEIGLGSVPRRQASPAGTHSDSNSKTPALALGTGARLFYCAKRAFPSSALGFMAHRCPGPGMYAPYCRRSRDIMPSGCLERHEPSVARLRLRQDGRPRVTTISQSMHYGAVFTSPILALNVLCPSKRGRARRVG